MKNITPKDTRYIPLTQQKSCCVPTSINMVMYRQKIPLISQELLGYHLGLILDEKSKKLFWNVRTGKRPANGYGTQMSKKQFAINTIFKKLKIPLVVTVCSLDNFKNKQQLITKIYRLIKKNRDLIVLLGSDVLNGTKNKNGHACVIDRIYPTRNLIRLIDPAADQPKWREIKIEKFIKAIKKHPTGRGRILELKKDRL